MGVKIANNAISNLAAAITSVDTTLTVTSGDGAKFPILGAGDYFYATISSVSNGVEIVKVTARADDVFTITRAQEGTSAIPFPNNSRIEQRITAQTLQDFIDLVDDYLLL
jgi:hypothetical protein